MPRRPTSSGCSPKCIATQIRPRPAGSKREIPGAVPALASLLVRTGAAHQSRRCARALLHWSAAHLPPGGLQRLGRSLAGVLGAASGVCRAELDAAPVLDASDSRNGLADRPRVERHRPVLTAEYGHRIPSRFLFAWIAPQFRPSLSLR